MAKPNPFRAKRSDENPQQTVVLKLPIAEVDEVDKWGLAAGMPSRKATYQRLVKEGLKVVRDHRVAD